METKKLNLTSYEIFFMLVIICCLFCCTPQEDKNKEIYVKSIQVITIDGDTATISSHVVNGWTDERSITIKKTP